MSKSGKADLRHEAANVDVLIAGAGPAGALAARHLALAGRSVLIVDRLRPASPRLGETLPGAGVRLLARQGLGAVAEAGAHHAPVGGGLTVWGGPHAMPSDALRDPYGPGLRLDRAQFDAALRSACRAAGCSWWTANLQHLQRDEGGWHIDLHDGRCVRAGVVIDATGRAARVVRRLGVSHQRTSELVAVYRIAHPATNNDLSRTVIEATPDGWIYAGRLADGRWAVGYHTLPKTAVQIRQSSDLWAATLSAAPYLRDCLGPIVWAEPGIVREAGGIGLSVSYGDGWLAVGDAALAFDPIAGQGLFNALRTGLAAAEALLAATPSALSAYGAELARVAAIYAGRRAALYQAETRWADRPFWQAQQQAAILAAEPAVG
ncbi:NAD(P)/FAD-dependent oxidoreductase [Elstera cyanobacteriorum]|uniref:NAD(P)/FAD-dependent oxidoreductase n=1 Tax=Elstera cyanobacteriorum TaxID=2022747 RepID=UPI002356F5B8|nr:FAD-dependent monooxygenase [Elstera cyanobacteriorum]MCK6444337.1 tryptophan 7-halogenase [Elstera cyanobacteriorum]